MTFVIISIIDIMISSIPSLLRKRTIAFFELSSAVCLGVFLYSSIRLISAPQPTRALTQLIWPALAAK